VTRDQIAQIIARGLPFTVRMADGKDYPIPHRDYISLPPVGHSVIVYDDKGRFYILPFRTITAIESQISEADE